MSNLTGKMPAMKTMAMLVCSTVASSTWRPPANSTRIRTGGSSRCTIRYVVCNRP
ncbi:MAG TPA: hypothetical protein VFY93_14810 [Planctomycetota bacterium]|nr:hypothetical protein [Planctomycetota bacterium]